MEIPFRLVDVFTDRPLAGNQLCVIPQPVDADARLMQAVAREIGFSETTFVTALGTDRYRMRIFTPTGELPFAGHPTLGTAYVLVAENKVRSPAIQEVRAGEFAVEVDVGAGFAWMRQHAPVFGPEVHDRKRVAAAVGVDVEDLHPDLSPQPVSTGLRHLLVPLRGGRAVSRAAMDSDVLAELITEARADACYLFAMTGKGEARARLFAPGVVLAEDPATGSAAGALGAYLAARGAGPMPGRLAIRQGEEVGRPSTLYVEVQATGDNWAVLVGGGVRLVAHGTFHV